MLDRFPGFPPSNTNALTLPAVHALLSRVRILVTAVIDFVPPTFPRLICSFAHVMCRITLHAFFLTRNHELSCQSEDSVPDPLYCGDVPMEDQSPNDEIHSITSGFQEMVGPSGRVGMATPTSVAAGNSLRATASPQMLTLGEMEEFDRIFLILVYLAE